MPVVQAATGQNRGADRLSKTIKLKSDFSNVITKFEISNTVDLSFSPGAGVALA